MSLPSLINDGGKLLKIFRTFALAVGCDPSASASQLVQCLQVFNLIISSILSHCYLIPQKVPLEQLISHVRLFDHEDKVFLVAQLSTTLSLNLREDLSGDEQRSKPVEANPRRPLSQPRLKNPSLPSQRPP